MYVFGHVGLTLGAAALGAGVYDLVRTRRSARTADAEKVVEADRQQKTVPASFSPSWTRLNELLDIRVLLVGSLFPDVIDKPIGYIFLQNGRTFSHTLLFALLCLLPAVLVRGKQKRRWLSALSIGVFAHLIFDQMWLNPQVLFWPLFGLEFPRSLEMNWLQYWLNSLLHVPSSFIPELIGAVVVLAFTIFVIRRKKVIQFLTRGALR